MLKENRTNKTNNTTISSKIRNINSLTTKSLITEQLGLYGWTHLEPVILAALATEMPMLLIGKHGCAKSFLLERLAKSLNMVFRCYNASLINYDDLVGIPIPANDNTSLKYISNKSAIWESEVVFIDEINRTKPELQNKLFPIIYDKRIQGQDLEKLKYRWAAMNPPCLDEDDDENNIQYLGAMPLDPALADRFPFVITVPNWENLNETQQTELLYDQFQEITEFPFDISKLIDDTKIKYKEVVEQYCYDSAKYISALMKVLQSSIGYISARRAKMLQQTLLAIHAARLVLAQYNNIQKDITLEDSAYLALPNTLSNTAMKELDLNMIISMVAQAWNISQITDDYEKKLLLIDDPVKRLSFAINNNKKISVSTLASAITKSISEISGVKKRATCLATYLAIRKFADIPATVIETIAINIRPCFEPSSQQYQDHIMDNPRIAYRVRSLIGKNRKNENVERQKYRSNLLNSFLPDGFTDETEVQELYEFFNKLWEDFKL